MSKKQQIHLNVGDLKEVITETLKNLLKESRWCPYGQSGTCEYHPGEDADITEEEMEQLPNYMDEVYYITFNGETTGDGYEYPMETTCEPSEEDIEKVKAAINNIPYEHLRKAMNDEFNNWLSNACPDMDYNEPDPDRFRDELDEDVEDEPFKEVEKELAWREYVPTEIGDRNPDRAFDQQDITDHYNRNIKGTPMPQGELKNDAIKTNDGHYWFPNIDAGPGPMFSLNAQSDDPQDRRFGQTNLPTWKQSMDATMKWGENEPVNEALMNKIRKLVREAMEEENNDNSCLAIQTRTGLYELKLSFEKQSPDPEMMVYQGTVGQTMVYVMAPSKAFEQLKTQGVSCAAKYKNMDINSDWMDCTLSIYHR